MIPAPTTPLVAAGALPGAVSVTRTYPGALGRGCSGTARLTPRAVEGVVTAPVTVPVIDGLLTADLLPGTYDLLAQLRTVDGELVHPGAPRRPRGTRA